MLTLIFAAAVVLSAQVPVASCYLIHRPPNIVQENEILTEVQKHCLGSSVRVQRDNNGALIRLSCKENMDDQGSDVSFNLCIDDHGMTVPVK